MSWADVGQLEKGHSIEVNPSGRSMEPVIMDGQKVTVYPVRRDLQTGDIVLVQVKKSLYLHFIKEVEGDRYLIGSNKGKINGWVTQDSIYGMVSLEELSGSGK